MSAKFYQNRRWVGKKVSELAWNDPKENTNQLNGFNAIFSQICLLHPYKTETLKETGTVQYQNRVICAVF